MTLVTIFGFSIQCLVPNNCYAAKKDDASLVCLADSIVNSKNNELTDKNKTKEGKIWDYNKSINEIEEFFKTKEGKVIVGSGIGAILATLATAYTISNTNKTDKGIKTGTVETDEKKADNDSNYSPVNKTESTETEKKGVNTEENKADSKEEHSNTQNNMVTNVNEKEVKEILKNVWGFIVKHKYYAIGTVTFLFLTIIFTLKPVRKFFWKKIGRHISKKRLGVKRFIQKHIKDASELGLLNYQLVKDFYKENWWKYYDDYKIVTISPTSKEFWQVLYEIHKLFLDKYNELGKDNEDVKRLDDMIAVFIDCFLENADDALEFFKNNLTSSTNWEFLNNSKEICTKLSGKPNDLMPLKCPFSVSRTASLPLTMYDKNTSEDALCAEIAVFRNMYLFAVDHFALVSELLEDIGDEDGQGKENYDDLKTQYSVALATYASKINSSIDDSKEVYAHLAKQCEIAKIIINTLLGEGYYKGIKDEFKSSQWANAPGEKNYKKAKFFCEKLEKEVKKSHNIDENLDFIRNLNIENNILINENN